MVKITLNIPSGSKLTEDLVIDLNFNFDVSSLKNVTYPTITNTSNNTEPITIIPELEPNNSRVYDVTTIKKFDIANMLDVSVIGKTVFIVGQTGTGKTVLAKEIFDKTNLKDCNSIVIDPCHKITQTPWEATIIDGEDEREAIRTLETFKKCQELTKQKRGLVLDQFPMQHKCWNNEIFNWLFFNSRHYHVLQLITSQHYTSIPKGFRTNSSYVICCRVSSPKMLRLVWEECAPSVETFEMFLDIYRNLTKEGKKIVFDIRSNSTRIEDCIYWI